MHCGREAQACGGRLRAAWPDVCTVGIAKYDFMVIWLCWVLESRERVSLALRSCSQLDTATALPIVSDSVTLTWR